MTPAVMFRQQTVRLFLAVAAICVGAVCGSLVPTARNALEAASFVLLALPMGFAALRGWRGGIFLWPDRVEVRGILRTAVVPMEDVVGFRVGRAESGPVTFGPACILGRRTGKSVVSYLVLPFGDDEGRAGEVVDRMNAALSMLRAAREGA